MQALPRKAVWKHKFMHHSALVLVVYMNGFASVKQDTFLRICIHTPLIFSPQSVDMHADTVLQQSSQKGLPNEPDVGMIRHMQFIISILPVIQLILSVLLIIAVLLQVRGSSVGGAFGGGDTDTTFYTRRGGEKMLFTFTVVIAVLFALSAFVALFFH